MNFFEDGSLVFKGGFEYWNPARWSYDKDQKELHIVLGGRDFPATTLKEQKARRPQSISRFNAAEHLIVLPFPSNKSYLEITGFLYHQRPCKAEISE